MFKHTLLASLLLVTGVHAESSFSSERFLGIEIGYSSMDTKSAIGSKMTSKDFEYGFRLGAQNDEWRTTLSMNLYGDGDKEFKRGILEFDRFVWQSLYKTDNIVFKPYLGGHIGYMSYSDKGGIDETGLLYGGQAGLVWNVLDEVDFDISYRYSISEIEEASDVSSFVFGANYIY